MRLLRLKSDFQLHIYNGTGKKVCAGVLKCSELVQAFPSLTFGLGPSQIIFMDTIKQNYKRDHIPWHRSSGEKK